ncbi:MAG TPA: hydrogenase 4 subunit B [Xanthomonadaceae bacterium]|nr:hydrogenase 4 subunit B [Xanthomonadaceae bacterium]
MSPAPLPMLLVLIGALLVLAMAAAFHARRRFAGTFTYAITLALALAALALAMMALTQPPQVQVLPLGVPWLGAHFRLDALSATFAVVINLGAAAASLYGIGHARHEREPGRVLPFFPAFVAGMNLVLLADDAFSFLLAWELMSLLSWALVVVQHRDESNVRAGYVYILMASFGTLALLLAFALLAGPEGGYAFQAMRDGARSPLLAATVLGLALLGAGSKAGLVPLHVWLPLAHPAAPSHVSALMSGVMTKVAVYAFVRIVFDLNGAPAWWWGVPVLIVGAASAALGVLYALMQDDIKRVLACSTIENIGFIFVALGLALAFHGNGFGAAAALALTAALLHVFNHALFKTALFLGAGAILGATGERSLQRLGGLIGRMPVTAVLMLVACAAIAALPPLNGFVSEWLAFQAILLSPDLPQWGLKLLIPAVGAVLALSAALAAACFVRLYGIAFLGRARSDAAACAAETDRWSLAAIAALALLCVLAGMVPGAIIDALGGAAAVALDARMPTQLEVPWLSIVPIAESRSSYNGLLVFGFIAASAMLAAFAIHRLASRALRRGPAWDCGFPNADRDTQYSAASFAQPIRRVFASVVFGARERVHMPPPGDDRPARLDLELHDPAWERIYTPLSGLMSFLTERFNHLQFLTIRRNLSLVFMALVFLLMVIALWT